MRANLQRTFTEIVVLLTSRAGAASSASFAVAYIIPRDITLATVGCEKL